MKKNMVFAIVMASLVGISQMYSMGVLLEKSSDFLEKVKNQVRMTKSQAQRIWYCRPTEKDPHPDCTPEETARSGKWLIAGTISFGTAVILALFASLGILITSGELHDAQITAAYESLPDYYEIIRVSPHATSQEISKAYKVAALTYHPDKNPNIGPEMMQKLNNAYEILKDTIKRANYDRIYREVYKQKWNASQQRAR